MRACDHFVASNDVIACEVVPVDLFANMPGSWFCFFNCACDARNRLKFMMALSSPSTLVEFKDVHTASTFDFCSV